MNFCILEYRLPFNSRSNIFLMFTNVLFVEVNIEYNLNDKT